MRPRSGPHDGKARGAAATDYGRWRRIYSNVWHEASFQALSDAERTVWLYAMTGPQSTSVGIYRVSAAVAVEDMGSLTAVEFQQRLDVVVTTFGWRYDVATRVLWIPTWLQENPPQSPNVCKSWRKLIGNLPDCDLKFEAAAAIVAELKAWGEDWRKAFGEAFLKPKAQPKAQAQSQAGADQGAGEQGSREIREQGAGEALTAVRPEWLSIARRTVGKYGHQTMELETLIDHFHHEGRPRTTTAKRDEIVAALRIALAERPEERPFTDRELRDAREWYRKVGVTLDREVPMQEHLAGFIRRQRLQVAS